MGHKVVDPSVGTTNGEQKTVVDQTMDSIRTLTTEEKLSLAGGLYIDDCVIAFREVPRGGFQPFILELRRVYQIANQHLNRINDNSNRN